MKLRINDPYQNFQLITLSNGFRIYYLESDKPWIKGSFVVNLGAKDDPIGKSGLVHFIEHLTHENHDELDFQDVLDFFQNEGGYIQAFTSLIETKFSFQIRNDNMKIIGAIGIFEKLLLNESIGYNFEKQRNIINQERKEIASEEQLRYSNLCMEFLFKETYLKNSQHAIGSYEEFNKISVEDCNEIYQKFYNPRNMFLVIVGDVSNFISLLEKSKFGTLNKGDKIIGNSEVNFLDAKKVNYLNFTVNNYPFLKKNVSLCFMLKFSKKQNTLAYLHKLVLNKILFSKFREELNANYGFEIDVDINLKFISYEIRFLIDILDHNKVIEIIFDCLESINSLPKEKIEIEIEKMKNGLIMIDESLTEILNDSVRSLILYEKIMTNTERLNSFEKLNYNELIEFNQFLINKANRYIVTVE